MSVGEGLSVAALLLSLLTIITGFAALQQKARGSYVEELAAEVDLLRQRVAACESRWKAADLEIAALQAENDALRIDGLMSEKPASYGQADLRRGERMLRASRAKRERGK